MSLEQIDLAVTFGDGDNFHMESIIFDVTHFDLPFNTILGHTTLAKFIMAVHYA